MSHNPPHPGGTQSTYPDRSEQSAARDEAHRALAQKAAADLAAEADAAGAGRRWPRYAAGAAIGSAAIAAALLYYNRPKPD